MELGRERKGIQLRGKYERTKSIKKKYSKSKIGEKNPNFKTGLYRKNHKSKENIEKKEPILREEIFKRDNFVCQMCVRKFNPEDLTFYFCTQKGSPTKNPNNILTICKECEKIAYEGSKWGKDKNGKQLFNRWNKEAILNFKICRMQTETVYPIGESPNKKWYSIIYGGKKRVEVNLNYKDRSSEDIIKSVVDFTKDKLKEAMVKVLKKRGQDPKDWNLEVSNVKN